MENQKLNLRNCHRAMKVQKSSAPEEGEWNWEWHGKVQHTGLFSSTFTNIATNVATGQVEEVRDIDLDLSQWEVTAWKYQYNFEDLYQKGVRAFEGTSHSPEVRSCQYIRDYEETLLSDLKEIPEAYHAEYYEKFRSWVETLFAKHANILSAMITGPARFNHRRNDAANNSYDKALQDFNKWRVSYPQKVAKKIDAAKSPEERADAEWQKFKHEILMNMATIKAIDEGTERGYRRALFVSSIFGKIERMANNGRTDVVLRALDFIKEYSEGLKKPIFTSRHKVWKLADVCRAKQEKIAQQAERENVEFELDGCTVVLNFGIDRIQISHDEKPSYEVRQSLKQHGFRWSPNECAWQRQMTTSAIVAAAHVVYPDTSTPESAEAYKSLLSRLEAAMA